MTSALTTGVFFSWQATATGGTPPYTWSATGLPTGISINSSTGLISGTPTAAGTFNATITVTDDNSDTANDTASFTVQAVPVASPHYAFVERAAALVRQWSALIAAVPTAETMAGLTRQWAFVADPDEALITASAAAATSSVEAVRRTVEVSASAAAATSSAEALRRGTVSITSSAAAATSSVVEGLKVEIAASAAAATSSVEVVITDPNFDDVVLLLHMDGTNGSTTFTDSSSNNYAITVNGDAQITTTDPKFGTGAGLFDGSGDYLSFTGATGFTGDFTIEAWVKPDVNNGNFTILSINDGTNVHINLGTIAAGNEWRFYQNNMSAASNFNITGGTVSTSAYQYIAARVSGTTASLWVDGVQVASATISGARTHTSNNWFVGRLISSFPREWNGRIDELRVTKGIARDVSSVPTAPFPDS